MSNTAKTIENSQAGQQPFFSLNGSNIKEDQVSKFKKDQMFHIFFLNE